MSPTGRNRQRRQILAWDVSPIHWTDTHVWFITPHFDLTPYEVFSGDNTQEWWNTLHSAGGAGVWCGRGSLDCVTRPRAG
jgi:hypothetical protein